MSSWRFQTGFAGTCQQKIAAPSQPKFAKRSSWAKTAPPTALSPPHSNRGAPSSRGRSAGMFRPRYVTPLNPVLATRSFVLCVQLVDLFGQWEKEEICIPSLDGLIPVFRPCRSAMRSRGRSARRFPTSEGLRGCVSQPRRRSAEMFPERFAARSESAPSWRGVGRAGNAQLSPRRSVRSSRGKSSRRSVCQRPAKSAGTQIYTGLG